MKTSRPLSPNTVIYRRFGIKPNRNWLVSLTISHKNSLTHNSSYLSCQHFKITGLPFIVASQVALELTVGSDNWRTQLMTVGVDLSVFTITLSDVTESNSFVNDRDG